MSRQLDWRHAFSILIWVCLAGGTGEISARQHVSPVSLAAPSSSAYFSPSAMAEHLCRQFFWRHPWKNRPPRKKFKNKPSFVISF